MTTTPSTVHIAATAKKDRTDIQGNIMAARRASRQSPRGGTRRSGPIVVAEQTSVDSGVAAEVTDKLKGYSRLRRVCQDQYFLLSGAALVYGRASSKKQQGRDPCNCGELVRGLQPECENRASKYIRTKDMRLPYCTVQYGIHSTILE